MCEQCISNSCAFSQALFLLFVLSKSNAIVFGFPYCYILFCCIFYYYPLVACVFSNERVTVRNFGILITKCDVSIKFFCSGLREPCRRGGGKSARPRESGMDLEGRGRVRNFKG